MSSRTGLIETEKKWNRIQEKSLTEIEKFMDSGTYEVSDRLKLAVSMVKESVKHQQVVLHEKVYELAARKEFGEQQPKKLKAG